MLRRIVLCLLAFALTVVCAAPAHAASLETVLKDYISDNRIDPCRYSEKELRQLKDVIPNDLNAYAADFVAAVDAALARRAEGACGTRRSSGAAGASGTAPSAGGGGAAPTAGGGTTGATGAPAGGGAGATPGATATAQPPPTPGAQPTAAPEVAARDVIGLAARTDEPAGRPPFPLLALAVLAALLASGGLLFGLVRWLAWEPAWANRFRHAAGEAGWRASTTWSEFTDFVRFGR